MGAGRSWKYEYMFGKCLLPPPYRAWKEIYRQFWGKSGKVLNMSVEKKERLQSFFGRVIAFCMKVWYNTAWTMDAVRNLAVPEKKIKTKPEVFHRGNGGILPTISMPAHFGSCRQSGLLWKTASGAAWGSFPQSSCGNCEKFKDAGGMGGKRETPARAAQIYAYVRKRDMAIQIR